MKAPPEDVVNKVFNITLRTIMEGQSNRQR